MEKENVWGKIRKTVLDGVTIAAEKTEEYTRLGKAKLDVLAVKRKITAKRTELGELVYSAVKDGGSTTVMDSDAVRNLIVEMGALENELGEKEKIYSDLLGRAESDVEAVKEKAMSGVEEIKTRAKSKVQRMRKKAETETGKEESESGKGAEAPAETAR